MTTHLFTPLRLRDVTQYQRGFPHHVLN